MVWSVQIAGMIFQTRYGKGARFYGSISCI
ncbi:MAG: DUF6783 domain-containing protein [Ruminococcus sp.]